jgi:membrane fusion protein, multidrug efflux system
VPNENRSLGCK